MSVFSVQDILHQFKQSSDAHKMKSIIDSNKQILFKHNVLFSSINMIPNTDIRSEIMNDIAMTPKYFKSNKDHYHFLLSIPNLDLAVTSTEKFAKNQHNFTGYSQRKHFILCLTDTKEKIRLLNRLLKEYPTQTQNLHKEILKIKHNDNEIRKSLGLRPFYRIG